MCFRGPAFADPRLTTWLCRRHLFAGQRVIAHFAGFRQPLKGRVGPRPPAGRIWVQLRPRQEIAARNRQGTVAVAATVRPSRHTQAPIQDPDRRPRTKPCRGWESTRPEQARPPADGRQARGRRVERLSSAAGSRPQSVDGEHPRASRPPRRPREVDQALGAAGGWTRKPPGCGRGPLGSGGNTGSFASRIA